MRFDPLNITCFDAQRPQHITADADIPTSTCSMHYRFSHLSEFYESHFNPVVFRMAMKVHRQGNDASKLLKLLGFNRIVFSRGLQDVSPHHNLSVEMWCRIVDNSFLVRKQIVYRIRSAGNWYWFRCLICPHIELRRARALVNQKTCLVKVNYGRTGLCAQFVADNGLEQCRYCNTEFQLNFQLVETEKLLLIITAWHDIGKGLSSRDPQ